MFWKISNCLVSIQDQMTGSRVSQGEAEAEQEEVAEEEPPQFVAPAVGRLLLKISTAAPMGRILCPEEGSTSGECESMPMDFHGS